MTSSLVKEKGTDGPAYFALYCGSVVLICDVINKTVIPVSVEDFADKYDQIGGGSL